jgi:hypothetical protein
MPEYTFDISDAVVSIRVVASNEATARGIMDAVVDQVESIQRVNDCQVAISLGDRARELYAVDGEPVFEDAIEADAT